MATSPRFVVRATLAIAFCSTPLVIAPAAVAQEEAPQVENSKLSFIGKVNANAVYVHSGAGENYYPTMKLDKDAKVTVVGYKFDWLKIVPPQGSFSYVGKLFIERTGDGSVGRVTRPDVRVRAGSSLNEFKGIVQAELTQGDTVQIIGEKDEYFTIVPPKNAYLYVNKQFVDPVEQIAQQDVATPAQPQATAAPAPAPVEATPDPMAVEAPAPVATETAVAETPAATDASVAATPSTQPATPAADALFDQYEVEFATASQQPLDQQPLDDLRAKYEALSADPALPESMRRIVDFRLSTLKVRTQARDEFVALKQAQEEAEKRQMAMRAEQEELKQQIERTTVKTYTAVGTLQTSSLQQGAEMLYRLTDPNTGRTVVYIRTNDAAMGSHLGQFIGVQGELQTDPRLSMKVISPTKTESVDPNNLYTTVAATVVPPSLMPREQATTAE